MTKTDSEGKLNVIWDMESSDPDDFLTLLLLAGHPGVNLRAVTVHPGSVYQVGLVRETLGWFGLDIPVGAYNINHPKECVSRWHNKVCGEIQPSTDAVSSVDLLLALCDEETTLISGAPLKNLGETIKIAQDTGQPFRLGRLVAQGGFAGEGVIPPEDQLDKFRGLETCDTYNLNGAPKAALSILASDCIGIRKFVSKNVCHGVSYDHDLHQQVAAVKNRSLSLQHIWRAMEIYLQKKPEGKKFHDPLAACCAINESIGEWAEVELYRGAKGHWGSRLEPGTGTWIITTYEHDKFLETFLAC